MTEAMRPSRVVDLDGSTLYEFHEPNGDYLDVEIVEGKVEIMRIPKGEAARHYVLDLPRTP